MHPVDEERPSILREEGARLLAAMPEVPIMMVSEACRIPGNAADVPEDTIDALEARAERMVAHCHGILLAGSALRVGDDEYRGVLCRLGPIEHRVQQLSAGRGRFHVCELRLAILPHEAAAVLP